MHILRPEDNMEEMRQRLAAATNRPVLVAGCAWWGGEDTRYRMPGASRYHHVGRLELFTSALGGDDRCVKVEDGIRFFDLKPAPYVHFIFPMVPEEKWERWGNEHFKKMGLVPRLNGDIETVFLTSHDQKIDPLIEPFVAEYRGIRDRRGMGVRFAVSDEIESPDVMQEKWHLGTVFGTKWHTSQAIQAPGHYRLVDGKPNALVFVQRENRTCLIDTTPGGCVRCHGHSGERIHFAVVASSQSAFPDGLVCRTCYPSAAKEWGELLANWTPPPNPSVAEELK